MHEWVGQTWHLKNFYCPNSLGTSLDAKNILKNFLSCLVSEIQLFVYIFGWISKWRPEVRKGSALISIALELKNLEHKDMTVILCFSCAKLEFTSLLNKPVEKNLVFKDFDVLFFKYSDRKKEIIKEIGHLTTRICCFHFMKNISLQFVCCLNEFLWKISQKSSLKN